METAAKIGEGRRNPGRGRERAGHPRVVQAVLRKALFTLRCRARRHFGSRRHPRRLPRGRPRGGDPPAGRRHDALRRLPFRAPVSWYRPPGGGTRIADRLPEIGEGGEKDGASGGGRRRSGRLRTASGRRSSPVPSTRTRRSAGARRGVILRIRSGRRSAVEIRVARSGTRALDEAKRGGERLSAPSTRAGWRSRSGSS
jgi:hypothetical protein